MTHLTRFHRRPQPTGLAQDFHARRRLSLLTIVLLTLWLLPTRTVAQGVAQAVYDSQSSVLTLKMTEVVHPEEGQTVVLLDQFKEGFNWPDEVKAAKQVVIDESFKAYRLPTCKDMFRNFSNLWKIEGLDNLNLSEVKNMSSMFQYCENLVELDLSEWQTGEVTDMRSMFSGCTKLSSIDLSGWHTSEVTDMSYMFSGCAALTELDVSVWNTSQVTNMGGMFNGCEQLAKLAISGLNTSRVTNMSYMFSGCAALTELNLSSWNTDKVTDMNLMFRSCTALTSINLSGWNTGQVTDMSGMFEECTALTKLDISEWNTSQVTNMCALFLDCTALTTLNISGWNTSKVTDISFMFSGSTALTSLDLSGWDTSQMIEMGWVFLGCKQLTKLNLTGWSTEKVESIRQMFYDCTALKTIYVSDGFKADEVWNGDWMFKGCTSLPNFTADAVNNDRAHWGKGGYLTYYMAPCAIHDTQASVLTFRQRDLTKPLAEGEEQVAVFHDPEVNEMWFNGMENKFSWEESLAYNIKQVVIDESFKAYRLPTCLGMFAQFYNTTDIQGLGNLNTEDVTDMSGMFNNCYSLTTLNLSGFNTEGVTHMSSMFSSCAKIESLDLSGFNTDSLTNIYSMFLGCQALTKLDLSGWNTAQVRNMSQTFLSCKAITSLVLSEWNTSLVTTMSEMFRGCEKLATLDLSGWNTSQLINMSAMFRGCEQLATLDLSGWNTSRAKGMGYLFEGCTALTSLNLSSFSTDSVLYCQSMFSDCTALKTIYVGDNFKLDGAVNDRDMFEGCTSLPYFNSEDVDKARAFWGKGGYLTYYKVPCAVYDNTSGVLTFGRRDIAKTADGSGEQVTVFHDPEVNENWFDGTATKFAWPEVVKQAVSVVVEESFNTYELPSCRSMFARFYGLTDTRGLDNLNVSRVTDMSSMFSWCPGLTSLDISGWNTELVTDMSYMFSWCSRLTSLDISGWNTGNVTNMPSLFKGCSALEAIYVGEGFTAKQVTYGSDLFDKCKKLPNFSDTETTIAYAHYRDDGYLYLLVGRLGGEPIGAQEGNKEKKLTCKTEVTLADDKDLEVFRPFTAYSVSYSRSFADGGEPQWQPVYLPFAVDAAVLAEQCEVGVVNNFHEYKQEDGSVNVELELLRAAEGTIPAFTPFLVLPRSGSAGFSVAGTRAAMGIDSVVDCSSVKRRYEFRGTFKRKENFHPDNEFVVREGDIWTAAQDELLLPQRWWLTVSDREGYTSDPATRVNHITIKVVGDGAATDIQGIRVIEGDRTQGGQHAEADGKEAIYDLQGRRLPQEPAHGIYIKNGKKHVK